MSKVKVRSQATPCELCGQPAYNINRHGEYTGKHTDLSECLRLLGQRVQALEAEGVRVKP